MVQGKNNITTILRKNMTSRELKLWQNLRNKNINNIKFRRQFKIGKYIVDFCSLTHKLVIEIDGGQHNEANNIAKDKERQEFIERQGFKVLRFWNNEIDDNINGVVEKIIDCALPHL